MRPLLFEIPLPVAALPLGPSLAALVVLSLLVVFLSARARAWDLVAVAAIGAVSAFFSAFRLRGATLPVGPLPIYSFGALLSAAMFAAWFLSQRFAERDGVSRAAVGGAFVSTAIAGLVGSRVLYVLTNLGDFHSLADVLAFRGGGLVFYGGALGGFAGAVTYLRRQRVPFLAFADVVAPCLALASAFGRVGCYLAGCDYGIPLSAGAPRFLARLGTFPRWPDEVAGPAAGSPAWLDQVLYRGLPLDSTESLPVHPAQLYESALALGLFAVLLVLRQRRAFRGELFLAYVGGYGALRFFLEMLRDDPERGLYGPAASPAVVWSLGFLVIAVAFALGLARTITSRVARLAAIGFAFALVPFLFLWLRASSRGATALSTSQWIAIATSIVVAVAFRRLSSGASGASGTRGPGAFVPSSSKADAAHGARADGGASHAENPAPEGGFTGGTVSS